MQSSQTSVTRTSTRHSTQDEDLSTYRPKSASKSVIIQRGGGGYGFRNRSSMYGSGGSGFSTRMSASINPAVYSQMAGSGIAGFRDTREKEKKEMQDCNERLATYIEKVRWLEAQNKKLEAENEALRKRKQEDWRPIKDMYEGELHQAREVIKELSTQKGVGEAKLASLQDEIDSLKNLIATYENNAKDYANKIDQLNSQIGEYEGELNTLRLRCGSLEDEVAKMRALINKYKEENARLRADLDAETAAHIEQEVLAQTLNEEVEFLREVLDKLQLTQQEPVTVKGMDMETYFKDELRRAIQEMNSTYEEKLDHITMECEAKVASQVNQLRSSTVRDTMEAEHAKSEAKRYRDMLAEKNARIADLESELASVRQSRDSLKAELAELQMEKEKMEADLYAKIRDFEAQVEALMQQLSLLMDAKMSLELEIACYKKLLEGEENRTGLRQLVEQTIGVRSGGASQLADMIGQSKLAEGSVSGTFSTTQEVQKSNTGPLCFKELDPNGGFVTIELNTSARNAQELRNLKIIRKAGGRDTHTVDLSSCELGRLERGQALTVFAKSYKSKADNKFEFISDVYSFERGSAEYHLMDGSSRVAVMKVTQRSF